MKTTIIIRTVLAAAALTAGSLAAQPMTTKVPFNFQVPGAVMPSGEYEVSMERHHPGSPIIKLLNRATKKATIVFSSAAGADITSVQEPSLGFACVRNTCQLSSVKPAGSQSFRVPTSRPTKNDEVLLTSVTIQRASR